MGLRKIDWADNEAYHLFDMVRASASDEAVVAAIAAALRLAESRGHACGITGAPLRPRWNGKW